MGNSQFKEIVEVFEMPSLIIPPGDTQPLVTPLYMVMTSAQVLER